MAELPRLPVTSDGALTVYMASFLRDTLPRFVDQHLRDKYGLYVGTGVPTVTAPDGSLFLRTDGGGKLYVRESSAWVAK